MIWPLTKMEYFTGIFQEIGLSGAPVNSAACSIHWRVHLNRVSAAGNPLPAASCSVTISGPPVDGYLEAAERQRHCPIRGGLSDRKRHQEPPDSSAELQLPAGDGRRGRGGRRPGGPSQSGAPRRPGQRDKQLAGVRGPQRAALPAV